MESARVFRMNESGTPDVTAEGAVPEHRPPARRSRPLIRKILRVVCRVAAIYLAIMVLMMFFEEKLIFFPSRYPAGDWQPPRLIFEDAEFTTEDGVALHGWYCPVEAPRRPDVLLFSHGNAGNITHRTDEVQLWQKHLGVSVLLYDYRGYGRSQGSPNEAGIYADGRAAYRWLVEQKQIAPRNIVLRGESIGCAVSLKLGLEVPHRALILQSPFTSAVEVGERSFPWLPVRWIMRNRFDNVAKIREYRGPVLIQHGEFDSIIPFEMGRRLFEHANEPKRFQAVRDADHNDMPFTGGAAFFHEIGEFLDGVSKPDSHP